MGFNWSGAITSSMKCREKCLVFFFVLIVECFVVAL